jgi:hypothetical protein
MTRSRLSGVLLTLIALLVGWWMIFDGVYVLRYGKYFGPDKPGPWTRLFIAAGVDPFRLGPLFIVMGTLWLVFRLATLAGKRWGRQGALATAIASLWYLPLGTVLSAIYIAVLWLDRKRTSR